MLSRSPLPEKYRPESFAAQATRKAIDAFNEFRPDIVLVIKGDMLGREWWDLLETSGVRYGTWLYDEMRRMSYTEEDLHHLGSLASYSPLDAQHLREQGFEVLDMPVERRVAGGGRVGRKGLRHQKSHVISFGQFLGAA